MEDLLAGLSHDMRTSMNGVAGMLALLLDAGLTPAQQQLAANAQHCAEDLMALIENVVDFSMIKAGRVTLAPTSFDLPSVLQAACGAPFAAARNKGLALRADFPATPQLQGDAGRLRQIIGSLLNSVVSLTRHGEIIVALQAADSGAGRFRISLTVNAPAFAPAAQQLIDLLNRPGTPGPTALPARGRIALDLALCKQLARLMSAQIEADNRPGEPACIRFDLELPGAPAAQDENRASPTEQDAMACDSRTRFAGRRILVVDGNPINQQVALRMLEKLGCRTDVAANGEMAAAMHAAHPYDLILMDCRMPRLDGYPATHRIRMLDGKSRHTPIVALSACATQAEHEHCLAKRMDDFVTMPVRALTLQQMLERWLAHATPEQAAHAVGCGDELEVVRDMFGTDFGELAQLYRNDSPPRIAALRTAGAAGDCAQVASVAHAFSGSNVSIGATGLSSLCKELEARAKANALDDFAQRMAAIETEYSRICGKLQAMCQANFETP